jgi:16S rRNA (guanine966-N2)-methyltransferase
VTRIVAGSAGGRRLQVPPKVTRPTSDRVREALFSALEVVQDLEGLCVLDLYAGSGALGFEALSRGAAAATFVESDRRAADVLRANANALRFPQAAIINRPAESVVAAAPDKPFDLIFADPPYAITDAQLTKVLDGLVLNAWTAPGTLLIVERASRSPQPLWPSPVESLRDKRYGDTTLYWAEHPPPTG